MWLFLALIATPLIEIALFIEIGGWIGLWPTILFVIATAALGAALLRRQGFETATRLRRELDRGDNPAPTLAHGALLLFAGALLLTPGFFTDAVGFTLLYPPARAALIGWAGPRLAARIVTVRAGEARRGPLDDAPIEAEYREVEPETPPQGEARRPPRG